MFWYVPVGEKCLQSPKNLFICGANLIHSPAAIDRCAGNHSYCEFMSAIIILCPGDCVDRTPLHTPALTFFLPLLHKIPFEVPRR